MNKITKIIFGIAVGVSLLISPGLAHSATPGGATVPQGGTGFTSLDQYGWLSGGGPGALRLVASTSPTVGSIYASSTTAINQFNGYLNVGTAVPQQLTTFASDYIRAQISSNIDDGDGLYIVNKSLGTSAVTFITLGNGGSPVTGPGYLATSTGNIVFAGVNWNGTPLGFGALLKNDLAIYPDQGNLVLAAPTTTPNCTYGNIKFITGAAGSFAGTIDGIWDCQGDLGVGSSTPYAKLSVTNTGTNPSLIVEDSTSPDITPFIIDATGLVGIGTTTPQVQLNVVRTGASKLWVPNAATVSLFERSSTAGAGAYLSIVGGNTGLSRLNFGDTDNEFSGIVEYNHSTETMGLYTGGNIAVKVTGDNKVGIGLSASLVPTGRLDLGTATNGECGPIWTSTATVQYSALCTSRSGAKTFLGAGVRTSTTTNDLFIDSAETTMGQAAIALTPFGTTNERGNIGFFTSPNTARTWGATSTMVEQMRLTNNGYLGIGATTTAQVQTKLHIKGGCTNTTGTTLDVCAVTIENSDQTVNNMSSLRFVQTNSVNSPITSAKIAAQYTDKTSGSEDGDLVAFTMAAGTLSEKMRITNTGNVGIGSTTPYAKLSITGAGSTTGVNFQTTNSSHTPLFTILDNGKVGVGTSSPFARFSVQGTANQDTFSVVAPNGTDQTGFQFIFDNQDTTTSQGNGLLVRGGANNDASSIFQVQDRSGNVDFNILGGGNVGIGTTSPSEQFHLWKSGNVTPTIRLERQDDSVSVGNVIGSFEVLGGELGLSGNVGSIQVVGESSWNSTESPSYMTFSTTPSASLTATEKLRITSSGNVGIGTTTPFANLQVTSSSANATTTAEIGKAGQNKGSCLKLYDATGVAWYYTPQVGTGNLIPAASSCASVTGF